LTKFILSFIINATVAEFARKEKTMRNQFGFTLMEFLVVVGIIVALAAVIIPNVTSYRGSTTEEPSLVYHMSFTATRGPTTLLWTTTVIGTKKRPRMSPGPGP